MIVTGTVLMRRGGLLLTGQFHDPALDAPLTNFQVFAMFEDPWKTWRRIRAQRAGG